jgi:hypothetical protein
LSSANNIYVLWCTQSNKSQILFPPPQKKFGGCNSESLYNLHTLTVQVTYSLTLYECNDSLMSFGAQSAAYIICTYHTLHNHQLQDDLSQWKCLEFWKVL